MRQNELARVQRQTFGLADHSGDARLLGRLILRTRQRPVNEWRPARHERAEPRTLALVAGVSLKKPAPSISSRATESQLPDRRYSYLGITSWLPVKPGTRSRLRGCGQLQGLPPFLHKKSQVSQPPIMPTLFESRKPKTCRIEKQQYHNPDRINRPRREPVVNGKKFARTSHRGRRNHQE
jgi:hypothetical protein